MSATADEFLSQTAKINDASVQPFPNSKKIYVQGSRKDIQVPMREISLTDTPLIGGKEGEVEKNAPVIVYDTSGPYTDPEVRIDIRSGLAPVRKAWICLLYTSDAADDLLQV